MKKRGGNWIMTYSGKKFWPLDPRPSEVRLTDIAHALSLLCRYGGHIKRFYSVAQHCVQMSWLCDSKPMARVALFHDASEAYLSDITRPVKRSMPEYVKIERRLEKVIAKRFKLEFPWPDKIKELDNRILVDEWMALGKGGRRALNLVPSEWKPLRIAITPWDSLTAETQFLIRAEELL